jgi:hypothetical protein
MGDSDANTDQLDRLLNDPEIAFQPDRVWALLAEISAAKVEALPPAPALRPLPRRSTGREASALPPSPNQLRPLAH